MSEQSYQNHAHRPVPTVLGLLFALAALALFAIGSDVLARDPYLGAGLIALVAAVLSLVYTSRTYTTKLQDRIIRLEMRVRGGSLLTPEQQLLLAQLPLKHVVALRFASDPELPGLLDRAVREKLAPADIKRSVKLWVPDLDRA
jgi:hypothetical protein